jgi:hypothetical protein
MARGRADKGPCILNLMLYRGQQSIWWSGSFTSGERASSAHWIEGLMGPWVSLDIVVRRKNLLLRGVNPWLFSPQPVTIWSYPGSNYTIIVCIKVAVLLWQLINNRIVRYTSVWNTWNMTPSSRSINFSMQLFLLLKDTILWVLCHVVWWIFTDILEQCTTSIFRFKE